MTALYSPSPYSRVALGTRIGLDQAKLRQHILDKLIYSTGKDPAHATEHDWFFATALTLRDFIVEDWMASTRRTEAARAKRVYYLSIEFLIGRLFYDCLTNLGLVEPIRQALGSFGVDLERVRAQEPDAALGNGGLGRLAACFLDSMASIALPAYGYGIRYDLGLFKQVFWDGWQHEAPEHWLTKGNPWEFERLEVSYLVSFGGSVEYLGGDSEVPRAIWHADETVQAVAYDTPIIGWRRVHTNTLRLWAARACDPFELGTFNSGDHVGALTEKARVEAISRILYPSDETVLGQELRLRQEYFFTSATLQDVLRRHLAAHPDLSDLADFAAIHMNDTHPSIAVVELLRLLFDIHGLSFADSWKITTETLNYTNHTLLPEALETWSLELMNRLLPRHMQLIFLINHLHLKRLPKNSDLATLASVSMIDEAHGRRVKMAHLAFIGSKWVNGVSALHTNLMRQTIFHDLDQLYPGRIVNQTNGITFRRWLHYANPGLTGLLKDVIGPGFLDEPIKLRELESFVDDESLHRRLVPVRQQNKLALARIIRERLGVWVNPYAMFDVQIKRIHEYKRQLLNIFETIALYLAISADPSSSFAPRVKIFAGKAAPSYARAKLIIKLANDVGRVINSDPNMQDRLKLVFLPNYNVTLAETLVSAADLSEQISTAGFEASGTGNMKLALNGALTIGTFDGANIEISENVGLENIFIFGLRADEVASLRKKGFRGADAVAASPRLGEVIECIRSGRFSPDDKNRFKPLLDAVLGFDQFMLAADFEAYWEAQRQIDRLWQDPAGWRRQSLLTTARMGSFSSDRTIRNYASEIWNAKTFA